MPMPIHSKCYLVVRGEVRMGTPPYCTRWYWTTQVPKMMPKKRKLLKKPLKMLYSLSPSFLAFISLNTCMKTKVLKMRV